MANNTQPQPQDLASGRLVSIGDTRLFIVEHGQGYPLLMLHGVQAWTIRCSAII